MTLTYVAGAITYQNIDLIPGATGVTTIAALSSLDDASTALDLGTNTFTFYGTTYTGASSLFVSSNALISFGSSNAGYINDDLTSSPSQAVIALFWDDLVTVNSGTGNLDDLVLYQFVDINADSTPDQLIIEWNNVHFIGSGGTDGITFQAILQLNTGSVNGDIIFNYVDLTEGTDSRNNGASATVGIKAAGSQTTTSDNRTLVSFNTLNPLVAGGNAILLTDVNDAPALTGTPATLSNGTEDTAYTINVSSLLQGYTDPDGNTISVANLTATNGTLTNNGTTYTFNPNANYNGVVNLNYNVTDGTLSVAGTNSFSLAAVNDAPVLTGTPATLSNGTEDTAYTISVSSLLQGYTDIDGNTLSVANLSATNGTLTNNGTTYTFNPNANYNGVVNLSYDVTDGTLSVAGTNSFSLAAVNDAPVITSGQSYSINENTINGIVVGTVAATDVENDSLSNWTITNGNTGNGFAINPTTGVITVNDSTALDFETNPFFNLTLSVSDGTDTSIAQNISINLNNLNEITYTPGVDNANGTSGNDYADLLAGNDRFNAGAGDDVADGGNDNDLIFGGTGKDNLSGGIGGDRLYGEIGNDTLNGNDGDDILLGGKGKDDLSGGIGGDRLYGEGGNDVLNGNDGNDILFGSTGNDTLNGGAGNDILYGEGGADTFVLNSGEGSDIIRDYQVGIDTISKGVGLSVTLAQSGSNVLIKEGSDVLATVLGVTTADLNYLV
jgi:Ca2+-binding RTX toxin-like protein